MKKPHVQYHHPKTPFFKKVLEKHKKDPQILTNLTVLFGGSFVSVFKNYFISIFLLNFADSNSLKIVSLFLAVFSICSIIFKL